MTFPVYIIKLSSRDQHFHFPSPAAASCTNGTARGEFFRVAPASASCRRCVLVISHRQHAASLPSGLCAVIDRKGNQSTKGLAAKKRSHIRTLTLPARTPELMPLDATLWKIIEDQVNDEAPEGTESKADFLARLKDVALELPRAVVKKAVARIPRVLRDIVASKGYHAKSD